MKTPALTALDVPCPTCRARKDQQCATDRGLRAIPHRGREEALKIHKAELRKLEAWNRHCFAPKGEYQ